MRRDLWKRLGKGLLFPPLFVMIPLLPAAAAALVCGMVMLGTEHPVTYGAYVLSAYTLTVWCVRIPRFVHSFQALKQKNRYAKLWFEDVRFRMFWTLCALLIFNGAYAVLLLGLGVYHRSVWYSFLGIYHVFLALMRLFLGRHTKRHAPGENKPVEAVLYRNCGWAFLLMNLALVGMVVMLIYGGREFHHGEITTIALAAYTFTAFTVATVNVVRYRRYQSLVYDATKIIELAAAAVSMLTLTATMLTTFGEGTEDVLYTGMLSAVGGAVSVFVMTMALLMILRGGQQAKRYKQGKGTSHES